MHAPGFMAIFHGHVLQEAGERSRTNSVPNVLQVEAIRSRKVWNNANAQFQRGIRT